MSSLTEIGGKGSIAPFVKKGIAKDPDLDLLAKKGRLQIPEKRVWSRGIRSQCHYNTSKLWMAGKIDRIVTGYALTPEKDRGMWSEHTWGLKGGRIVETTYPYVKYYGFSMKGKAADQFAQVQYDVYEELFK